jgi:nucleoid DNA-binding protein
VSTEQKSVAEHAEHLQVFVREITVALLAGKQYRAPGLGTFSICTRRAAPGLPSSTMAMFHASAELRTYASGGPLPDLSGPHARALKTIVQGMQNEQGIVIARLGRMAVLRVPGGKPKLIFHGAKELNERLAAL